MKVLREKFLSGLYDNYFTHIVLFTDIEKTKPTDKSQKQMDFRY